MLNKIFLLFILLGLTNSFSQSVYVNPGIKLGYMFGEKGGFILGFELSVTSYNSSHDMMWGFVFDYDETADFYKIHLGIEASKFLVGIDTGPTFAWDEEGNYYGFSVIPYAGAFIYPYYNFTFLSKDKLYHEIGSYIKITFPNKNFDFGRIGG